MVRNRIAPKAPPPAADLSLDETVLVDVLALTDALWTPLRCHTQFRDGASGSIMTRRHRFAREGVQLAAGKTGAERVQVGRAVGRLVRVGLLQRHRTRTKSLAVSLTCDGDEIARSLCGLSTVAEAFSVMTQMHLIGQTDFAIVEGGHPATERQPLIREIFLIGEPQYKNDDEEFSLALSSLHVSLAPALWRGWVSSHYDHAGRVCYHLEDAGWEIGQDEHDADRANGGRCKGPLQPESPRTTPHHLLRRTRRANLGTMKTPVARFRAGRICPSVCRRKGSLLNFAQTRPNASAWTCIAPSAKAA